MNLPASASHIGVFKLHLCKKTKSGRVGNVFLPTVLGV